MAGIVSMTDQPRDLREWNRVFGPLNQALRRVNEAGTPAVVADFDGRMAIRVDGVAIGANYALNLIAGNKIDLSGAVGTGTVDVTVALVPLVDGDIPGSIARDTEVISGDAAVTAGYITADAVVTAAYIAADASVAATAAANLASAISALNLASGTYTPTRSAEANLDSNITLSQAQYLRVGNTVTVSGRFTADPTLTATTTSFEGSLPIASNLGAAEDVAGTAFCGNIVSQGAEIIGVAANDTFKVQWKASDVTSQTWSYIFVYQLL